MHGYTLSEPTTPAVFSGGKSECLLNGRTTVGPRVVLTTDVLVFQAFSVAAYYAVIAGVLFVTPCYARRD